MQGRECRPSNLYQDWLPPASLMTFNACDTDASNPARMSPVPVIHHLEHLHSCRTVTVLGRQVTAHAPAGLAQLLITLWPVQPGWQPEWHLMAAGMPFLPPTCLPSMPTQHAHPASCHQTARIQHSQLCVWIPHAHCSSMAHDCLLLLCCWPGVATHQMVATAQEASPRGHHSDGQHSGQHSTQEASL